MTKNINNGEPPPFVNWLIWLFRMATWKQQPIIAFIALIIVLVFGVSATLSTYKKLIEPGISSESVDKTQQTIEQLNSNLLQNTDFKGNTEFWIGSPATTTLSVYESEGALQAVCDEDDEKPASVFQDVLGLRSGKYQCSVRVRANKDKNQVVSLRLGEVENRVGNNVEDRPMVDSSDQSITSDWRDITVFGFKKERDTKLRVEVYFKRMTPIVIDSAKLIFVE